jgi:hypothetical protein
MLAPVLAALIAQATPAATATPLPLFVPPAGWQQPPRPANAAPGSAGELGEWQNLSQEHGYETFEVRSIPSAGQSVEALAHSYAGTLDSNERPVGARDVTLCGGASGAMVEFQWTDGNNVTRDVHLVAAENGDLAYVALYERHASSTDSPEAMAALTSLCPTGVNATPSPIGLYVLRPPADWKQQPNAPTAAAPGLQLLGMYFGPSVDAFTTQMNVIRAPLADPNETVAARAKESADYLTAHGGTLFTSRATRLCNGTHDGWILEMDRATPERKLSFVQMLLLDGGFEYIATYSRPFGTPPEPAAMKALDSLCPLPTP